MLLLLLLLPSQIDARVMGVNFAYLVSQQAMMDRERKDELPQMQVEFIDVVCRPLYSSLSESFPWIKPLLDGCLSNREKWADLAEKVGACFMMKFKAIPL